MAARRTGLSLRSELDAAGSVRPSPGETHLRNAFSLFALALALTLSPPAKAEEPFRLGIMNDQSGPYADIAGPTSIQSVKMAIEDFGGEVLGKKIELLVADHQNKVDVGLNIARQWYDEKNVEAIFDISNSGVALALIDLAKSHHKFVIFDSASSSDLTGKACSANTFQWNADNWSNAVALMKSLDRAEARHFLFHHRRLRLWRLAGEGRARRDRRRRRQGARRGQGAAQHRRFLFLSCLQRKAREPRSSCSPIVARISPIR